MRVCVYECNSVIEMIGSPLSVLFLKWQQKNWLLHMCTFSCNREVCYSDVGWFMLLFNKKTYKAIRVTRENDEIEM
jgi:hypothetical protein